MRVQSHVHHRAALNHVHQNPFVQNPVLHLANQAVAIDGYGKEHFGQWDRKGKKRT